jgi:hypothetical protein
MNLEDIRVIKYHSNLSKRFGHWVFILDRRPQYQSLGKKGKKSLIDYFESLFGTLGVRWQYSKSDYGFIIKLNDERDLLIFLLKFKKN